MKKEYDSPILTVYLLQNEDVLTDSMEIIMTDTWYD